MEKGKFYIKKCNDLKINGKVFMLYGIEDIKDKKIIKIASVKAILIDRIVFDYVYEFFTKKMPECTCFVHLRFNSKN